MAKVITASTFLNQWLAEANLSNVEYTEHEAILNTVTTVIKYLEEHPRSIRVKFKLAGAGVQTVFYNMSTGAQLVYSHNGRISNVKANSVANVQELLKTQEYITIGKTKLSTATEIKAFLDSFTNAKALISSIKTTVNRTFGVALNSRNEFEEFIEENGCGVWEAYLIYACICLDYLADTNADINEEEYWAQ